MRTLVIDVGGTHVKLLATGKKSPITFESSPDMTPKKMVMNTLQSVNGWKFDNVSIGYPGAGTVCVPVASCSSCSPV
jgi:polyphosphate glucokinase